MAAVYALAARVRALGGRFEASPAELVALATLLCGGLALLGVLWWLTPAGGDRLSPGGAAPQREAGPGDGGAGDDAAAAAGASDGEGAADQPGGPEITAEDVVVHVAGAVRSPGLYRVGAPARIADAIAAAGGASPTAALEGVNLAKPLRDGEQLYVPDEATLESADRAGDSPLGTTPPGTARRPDGRVDINRADAAALESLPGVGPVLADQIVAHREANGAFAQPEDLLEVSGIGERTLAALLDLVAT